jgi:hypothetical protein
MISRAIWIPGWYELDPPLEVGLADTFVFWRVVPEYLQESENLVFYNTLWQPKDVLLASGVVVSIQHPEFGEIQKVDTRGLDYTFTLASGIEYLVNAEEEPGKIFEKSGSTWIESSRLINDWRFVVTLSELSELVEPKKL